MIPATRRTGRTLYAYLLREPVAPTLFAVGGFALVMLAADLVFLSELVINRGLGLGEVSRLALYDSLPMLSRTLPFAVLLGSLIALGRLGANQEILALLANGLPLRALSGPFTLFAAVATGIAIALSVWAAPWANRSMDAALLEFAQRNPGAALRPGVNHMGAWRLEVRQISPAGDELEGVLLWVPSVGETVFARRAEIERDDGGARIELEEGMIVLDPRARPRTLQFDRMAADLPALQTGSIERLAAKSMPELVEAMRSGDGDIYRRDARVEWHRRLALPISALLFGFLAVPLAAGRAHLSRSAGAVLGIVVAVAYYGLVQLSSGLVRGESIPIWAAVWMPDAALAAFGALLLPRLGGASGPRAARGLSLRWPWRRPQTSKRIRTKRRALPRYVMLRFAELAGMCFAALLVAYLLVDVLDNLKWFTKHAATPLEVARFYGARLPVLAARVVPLSLLVAASLTVSLLSVQGELVAMRACGIPTVRAVLPLFALCASAGVLYHGLANELVPRAHALSSHLKQTEIKNRPDTATQRRSAVWIRSGDYLYEAERMDPLIGVAHNVTLYELTAAGFPSSRTDALQARHIGRGIWRLVDAVRVEIDGSDLREARARRFAELGEDVTAEIDTAHLTLSELSQVIEEVESSGYEAAAYRVDFHTKLAAPLACLVLPALALIFAMSGPPFPTPTQTLVLSTVVAVAQVLVTAVTASLGHGGALPPAVAGWGPTAVFSVAVGWFWSRFRRSGQGL